MKRTYIVVASAVLLAALAGCAEGRKNGQGRFIPVSGQPGYSLDTQTRYNVLVDGSSNLRDDLYNS
jgi:hypothetical protein